MDSLLESWLSEKADVEAVAGGEYKLFWQPDDPANNSTIGCRVTAVFPPQLIAFQWRSPVQFKAFANTVDPLSRVVVSFIPEAEGTGIYLLHSSWRRSRQWEAAPLWQKQAWKGASRKLVDQTAQSSKNGHIAK